MTAYRVLVIEDNEETAKNIRLYLTHHGYQCQLTHSGAAGLAMFAQERFHLIILDIMLPDLNGYEVCERVRQKSDIPIIMLTAKVTDGDLVHGFEQGANDYVKKPYSNKELMARVKAHLRGYAPENEPQQIGPFALDKEKCLISFEKTPLKLTKTEFLLFQCLLEAPGRVFSRDHLCTVCFADTHESIDRTVDVHVHNLRKKILRAGLKKHGVTSVYGLGYKWELP